MEADIKKVALIAIVIFCSVLFGQRELLARQMNHWQLLPRPEHFSELYFTPDTRKRISQGDARKKMSFTVVNHEGKTTTYRYKITAKNTIEKVLASGTFDSRSRQHMTVTRALPGIDSPIRTLVRLDLEYQSTNQNGAPILQKQSLHYWTAGAKGG